MDKLPVEVWCSILRHLGQNPAYASRYRWRDRTCSTRGPFSKKPAVNPRQVPHELCALRLSCRTLARELAGLSEQLFVHSIDDPPERWSQVFKKATRIKVVGIMPGRDLGWISKGNAKFLELCSCTVTGCNDAGQTDPDDFHITSKHVAQVSEIKSLRELRIVGLKPGTDLSAMQHTELVDITIHGRIDATVSGKQVLQLGSIKSLTALSLPRVPQAAAGDLAMLPTSLRHIHIASEFTDDHMVALGNLRSLESISTTPNVSRGITDHGLAALHQLSNLRHVELIGSGITRQGVAALREGKKSLLIYR